MSIRSESLQVGQEFRILQLTDVLFRNWYLVFCTVSGGEEHKTWLSWHLSPVRKLLGTW